MTGIDGSGEKVRPATRGSRLDRALERRQLSSKEPPPSQLSQAGTLAELAEEPIAPAEPSTKPPQSRPLIRSGILPPSLPPLQPSAPPHAEGTHAEKTEVTAEQPESDLPRGVEHVSSHNSDVEVRDIRYVMEAARRGDPVAQEYMRTIHRAALGEILGGQESTEVLDGIGDVFSRCYDGTEIFRGDGTFALDAHLESPTLHASGVALKELNKIGPHEDQADSIAAGLRTLLKSHIEPGPKEVAETLLRIRSKLPISEDAARKAVMMVFGEEHPGAWETVRREMAPINRLIDGLSEFAGQIDQSSGYQTFLENLSLIEEYGSEMNFVDNVIGSGFGTSGGRWSPMIWLYREYVGRVYHGHHVLHEDSEGHLVYGSGQSMEADSPIRYPIPDVVKPIGNLSAEDIEHLAELGGAGIRALIKGEKEPEEYFAEKFSQVFAQGVEVYMADIPEVPDDLIMVSDSVEWLARVLEGDENGREVIDGQPMTLAEASEHAGQRRDSGGFMVLRVPPGEGVAPFENIAVIVPPYMPEEATRLLEERYPQVTFIRTLDEIPDRLPFLPERMNRYVSKVRHSFESNMRHPYLFVARLVRELRRLPRVGEVDQSRVVDAIHQSGLRTRDVEVLTQLNEQHNMGTFDSMVLGLMEDHVPDVLRRGLNEYRQKYGDTKSFFADLARGRIKGRARIWSLPGPVIDYLRIRFDPTSRVARIRSGRKPLPRLDVPAWPHPVGR